MFFWDPSYIMFTIPYIDYSVSWYFFFFATGLIMGVPFGFSLLLRFFYNYPQYTSSEIRHPKNLQSWGKSVEEICNALNHCIMQAPIAYPEKVEKQIEQGCCVGPRKLLTRLSLDSELKGNVLGLHRKTFFVIFSFYCFVFGSVFLGARVGHLLFYDNPSVYLNNPLTIFYVWEGGRSSHGAACALVLATWIYGACIRRLAPMLTRIRSIDIWAIPFALCSGFIRVGNFFTQEILGVETLLPWGVVYGNPVNQGNSMPLHPVQLYESFAYLAVFFLLWRLSYRSYFFLTDGKIGGLAFILLASSRFCIEFLKFEQSHIVGEGFVLTMGQFLSVPLIAFGFCLYFKDAILHKVRLAKD